MRSVPQLVLWGIFYDYWIEEFSDEGEEDGAEEDVVVEDGVPEDGVPEDGVPEDGAEEEVGIFLSTTLMTFLLLFFGVKEMVVLEFPV